MPEALSVPQIRFATGSLRPWSLQDIDVLKEASVDPYIPLITSVPHEWSMQAAQEFAERQLSRARDRIGYSLAIADQRGETIGHIGLWIRDLDLGRASIGYWIVQSARGSGIASAALTALSEWAFSEILIPRLELYIEPWNTASIATAEKSLFSREGLLRCWCEIGGERRDMYMFARINPHTLPASC